MKNQLAAVFILTMLFCIPIIAQEISAATDESAPSLPGVFHLEGGDRHIKLSWEADLPTGSERIFLERSEDDQVFTIVTEFPATSGASAKFTDGMVHNGKRYFYRLAVRSAGGKITFFQSRAIVAGNSEPGISGVEN